MPKDRIAEWLLVLVTSRERAASIVGDIMESSPTRGRVWWWSAVLRAAASLLWGGFANSPLGMLGLAFRAWLMGLLLGMCSIIFASILGAALGIYGIAQQTLTVAVFILCQFFVGRWLAWQAPGRELSAWLALLIIGQFPYTLPFIVQLARGHPFSQMWRAWQPLDWTSGVMYLSCLAGTIWVRERAVT